jgi:hypothetical protein
MKTRVIHRVFDIVQGLGYENLVVGGCSFTYNINELHSSQWPYYLRDLCGFADVYDCSLPGAGNRQIATSVQWALETQAFDPNNTLVVAMWSGHTRLGSFNDASQNGFQYSYAPNVYWNNNKQQASTALRPAQSVENYLHVLGLKTYLEHQKYPHVFLDFVDYSIPNRSNSFDITQYLPETLAERYRSWFANIDSIYKFCVQNDLLDVDDFHPNSDGHLAWTRQVLVPYLTANFDAVQGLKPVSI